MLYILILPSAPGPRLKTKCYEGENVVQFFNIYGFVLRDDINGDKSRNQRPVSRSRDLGFYFLSCDKSLWFHGTIEGISSSLANF